jgi:Rod binding domain-containing protein
MSPAIPILTPAANPAAEPSTAPSARNSPENIQKAASQFEALMIGQMLQAMRADGKTGWMGGGDDASGSTMIEFAEQEFAKVMAASGGFGLAKMVTDSLRKSGPAASPSSAAGPAPDPASPTAPVPSRP